MKILVISLALLIFHSVKEYKSPNQDSSNNCASHYDLLLRKQIYDIVDEMPQFPGGQDEYYRFLSKHFIAQKQEEVQGTIKAEFVIDASGTIINAKVLNKEEKDYTPNDKEMLRVLGLMPRWKPAKCNNKEVAVKYPLRMFISFQE